MNGRAVTLLAALVFAACQSEGILTPSAELNRLETIEASQSSGGDFAVLTWNVYVGARLENLLTVTDPNEIPLAVTTLVGQVVATDFASRAAAIAAQIDQLRPDVVSLQEVSQFRLQSPGDFLIGNPTPATDAFMDWRTMLMSALAARGLPYSIAAQTMNFDIELPMVNTTTFGLDDIRLTDYDVVLVRDDVRWKKPDGGNFAAALPIDLGGFVIQKPSGWVSVDVRLGTRWYRYFNTHLEAADVAPGVVDPALAALQAAQAAELSSEADASPFPVIVTGDLNSAADGTSTPTYQALMSAGFSDAWIESGAAGPGYTANQAPDLMNPSSQLYHRIDFVLFRSGQAGRSGLVTEMASVELLGEALADRTPGGLWPSDHAGVFAALTLTPGDGVGRNFDP